MKPCADISQSTRSLQNVPAQEQGNSNEFRWEINPLRIHKGRKSRDLVDDLRKKDFEPLSATDKTIETRLQDSLCNPTDVLRQAIKDGVASAHVVLLCLAAKHEKVSSSIPDGSKDDGDGIAAMVVDHIWTDEKLWGPIVMHARQAQVFLCYFAILEKLDGLVLEWTTATLPGEPATASDTAKHVWRGGLLRSLLLAKLSCDPSKDAGSAIQCFFAAAAAKRAAVTAHKNGAPLNVGARCLSLLPSYIELQKTLTGGGFSVADRNLFDKFAEFQGRFGVLARWEKEFDGARLLLYRPDRPTEMNAIDLLRRHTKGEKVPSRIHPPGSGTYRRHLRRSADVLDHMSVGSLHCGPYSWHSLFKFDGVQA